jgi:hypothetical protein
MSRRATGSVYFMKDPAGVLRWHSRIQQADGSRPYDPIETAWALDPNARERAKKFTADAAARIRHEREHPAGATETFRKWLDRFHASKTARGKTSVPTMKGRAEHFLPELGDKAIGEITATDVEAIVSKLDAAIVQWTRAGGKRGEGLSYATAANVWGDLSHALGEAANGKERGLRVLAMNPAANVRGPDAGPDREGPILYGSEVVALLAGRAVDEGACSARS